MINALRNVWTEVVSAIWFYKVPLMVLLAIVYYTTGNATASETTLLVVLALGVLLYDIWIEVSE